MTDTFINNMTTSCCSKLKSNPTPPQYHHLPLGYWCMLVQGQMCFHLAVSHMRWEIKCDLKINQLSRGSYTRTCPRNLQNSFTQLPFKLLIIPVLIYSLDIFIRWKCFAPLLKNGHSPCVREVTRSLQTYRLSAREILPIINQKNMIMALCSDFISL